ncbi:hypothetical protein V8E53_008949 [Lactarius tabidus]
MSENPQDMQSYPLRLPNYRSLHQGRYHPYPTFNRQQGSASQEFDNVEVMDPTVSTDEAGPSPQQDSPTQPQLAATNESGDTDLTNLATVVDELQSSRPGSATPRDHVSLAVALASAMRRRPVTTDSETSHRT